MGAYGIDEFNTREIDVMFWIFFNYFWIMDGLGSNVFMTWEIVVKTRDLLNPRRTNHEAGLHPTRRARSGNHPGPIHHVNLLVPASTSIVEHASRWGIWKDGLTISRCWQVCTNRQNTRITWALWSSALTTPSFSRQYLTKRSNNSDIWILQYGSHPTKKIQLHTATVVDSITVPPSFIEVDHNLRNTVFRQSLKRLV